MLLDKVSTADEVMEELTKEDAGWKDTVTEGTNGLSVDVADSYNLIRDGQTLLLSETGYGTSCRTMHMQSRYFKKYPDKREFAEHFNTLKLKKKGLLIREKGGEVKAVLDRKWKPLNNDVLIGKVLGYLKGAGITDIKGIIRVGSENLSSFRIPFGNTLVKTDQIFPMLEVKNSEVGLTNTAISIGSYRVICTNGAIGAVGSVGKINWNHKGDINEFFKDAEELIKDSEQVTAQLSKVLTKSQDIKVALDQWKADRFISNYIYKLLTAKLKETGGGNLYDAINILTDHAKQFPVTKRRHMEEVAVKLMVQASK